MSLPTLATDEDVANRATGDWSQITPRSQLLAGGSDGAFGSDRWTLSSATNDFAAQGVAAGSVVILGIPTRDHDLYGVASVAGSSVTLRRRGLAAGVGVPPSLGGQTGVTFSVPTVAPQIESASSEIRRRYNILSLDDLQDPDDLKQAVVLWTLVGLYNDVARNVGERSDDFASKARLYKSELNSLLQTLDGLYATNALGAGAQSAPMTESEDAPFPFSPWC